MLMVVYNEVLDDEVMEILDEVRIKGYTKVPEVFGRGEASGTHLGTDIWPGLNNILYIACQDNQLKELLIKIRQLRGKSGHEGIKAFVLPLEEVT
ncbi:MAG: PG0541 family transporter-associated protein [Candidatus Omnitrophota bacterium]